MRWRSTSGAASALADPDRAVDEARRTLKPAIPSIGEHGIELHDEIELTREVPAGVV